MRKYGLLKYICLFQLYMPGNTFINHKIKKNDLKN